jgi:hypothetical protein
VLACGSREQEAVNRFARYVEGIVSVIGHATRAEERSQQTASRHYACARATIGRPWRPAIRGAFPAADKAACWLRSYRALTMADHKLINRCANLIRSISLENPLWRAPTRIHGEQLKLGTMLPSRRS